jgi:hypothetical protein
LLTEITSSQNKAKTLAFSNANYPNLHYHINVSLGNVSFSTNEKETSRFQIFP